jgi:endonuclease/exonuclease/phosphatase (EEP) superfamily protein YafD
LGSDRRQFGRAAIGALALACTRRPPPRSPATASGPQLRLLTYNVNYGLAGDQTTVAAIRDADADLALLQETNVAWEQAIRRALGDRYPAMLFKHRGGGGGLAVLSRRPIAEAEIIAPIAEGWFPAGRVVVDTAFGPLQALNVHLRPPVSDGGSFVSGHFTTPAVRLREIQSFVTKLKPALPTVIAGDFNEEPRWRRHGISDRPGTDVGSARAGDHFRGSSPVWTFGPPSSGGGAAAALTA